MESKINSVDESLKLVRALRLAQDLNGIPQNIQQVRKDVLHKIHQLFNLSKSNLPQESSNSKKPTLEQLELQLRKLIQDNSSWSELSKLAWAIFELNPTPDTSSYLVELAVLYGGVREASDVLDELLIPERPVFYHKIHPAVRQRILICSWTGSKHHKIWHYLLNCQKAHWLEDYEKLFVFMFLYKKKQHSLAWHFYQIHHIEINKSSDLIRNEINIGKYTVLLFAARLTAQLGRVDEGINLIRKIPVDAKEYPEGVKALHSLGAYEDFFNGSTFHTRLSQEKNWEARLKLFESFIIGIKSTQNHTSKDLLAVNSLLKKPLLWFPKESHIWESISVIICKNIDTINKLPNILDLFKINAFVLNRSELDLAIWRPILEHHKKINFPKTLLVLARIHYFVCSMNEFNDDVLFEARRTHFSIHPSKISSEPIYYSWESLWSWGFKCIQENNNLLKQQKENLFCLMRSSVEHKYLSTQYIDSYLKIKTCNPPRYIIKEFTEFAKKKGSKEIEILCILKGKSKTFNFTNNELKRIWFLSVKRQKHDLAWRSLTILKSRTEIPEGLKSAWQLSGEQKQSYPILKPNALQIDSCLHGFSREEVRLIWTCLKLGVNLPILLAHQDSAIHISKNLRTPKESFDIKLTEVLDSNKLFGKQKKEYTIKTQQQFEGIEIPMFVEVVLDNSWCRIMARISHRMGVSSWNWQVSNLIQSIRSLKQNNTSTWQPFHREDCPIQKWLKNLDADQRTSWHDLSHTIDKLDDEQGFRVLSCFIVRLTTLIYQNHYQALDSLKKMRAPIFLVWDLESWILSPEYSKMRSQYNWEHVFNVPHSLTLNPILGE